MRIHRQMHTGRERGEGLLQPRRSSGFTPRSSRGAHTARGRHDTPQGRVLKPSDESSQVSLSPKAKPKGHSQKVDNWDKTIEDVWVAYRSVFTLSAGSSPMTVHCFRCQNHFNTPYFWLGGIILPWIIPTWAPRTGIPGEFPQGGLNPTHCGSCDPKKLVVAAAGGDGAEAAP